MTLLLLLTSSNLDAQIVSVPAAASAGANSPAPTIVLQGAAGASVAGVALPALAVGALPSSAAASAFMVAPGIGRGVVPLSANAAASANAPVVGLAFSAFGEALASALAPDLAAVLAALAGESLGSVSTPTLVVAVEPGAAEAAAAMGLAGGLVSPGDYLRAALTCLESEQVVIQAELIAAAAANDESAVDDAQNRASVCSIAIAEVERAIEFDDIRGPYVPAPEGASTASAVAPAVAVS